MKARICIFSGLFGLLIGLSSSCSSNNTEEEKGLPPVPDFLMPGGSDQGGGRAIGSGTKVEDIDFSKLEWTNPDDVDAPIPALDNLFRQGTTDRWENSLTRAKASAIRNEQVILLWFTDSDRSSICKALDKEVWRSNEFKSLSRKRLKLVRLDFNVKKGDANLRHRKKKYLEGLKKEYKALGLPSVVLLTPDGQFSHRERGYVRGQAEYYYQQLKFRVEQAEQQYQGEKERLRKKGYRDWRARDGSKLFAKYIAHRDGILLLQRMDKERVKVRLSSLSSDEQAWIGKRLQAAR